MEPADENGNYVIDFDEIEKSFMDSFKPLE